MVFYLYGHIPPTWDVEMNLSTQLEEMGHGSQGGCMHTCTTFSSWGTLSLEVLTLQGGHNSLQCF